EGTPLPASVATPISRARTAYKAAKKLILAGRYQKALEPLATLRRNVSKADAAGIVQMSTPPPPEEDTPPGPASVIAVLDLEHDVDVGVARLFNGLRKTALVTALNDTIQLSQLKRNSMLDAVVAAST